MSEDKNTEPSDIPTGEAADQWFRQRRHEGSIDDSKKETVRQLFHLGAPIFGIADKIDLKNSAVLRELMRDELSLVKLKSGLIDVDFHPFMRGHGTNLTLYNREIDQIGLLNKDHFGTFYKFFEGMPIYEVKLSSHEEHDPDKNLHTYAYALSEDGQCIRASWNDIFDPREVEYTTEIDPGEIEMVAAAMNILRGQLEKHSPAVPV